MTTVLTDLLNDNEYELMVEAMYALRERKVAALNEAKQHPATQSFTARDFGMPQIDALLTRLDAKVPEALQASDARLNATPAAEIGIRLEGGVIQSIWANAPVNVLVIDYDTEDRAEDELFDMPQSDGSTSACVIKEFAADVMPKECDRIRAVSKARVSEDDDEVEGMRP